MVFDDFDDWFFEGELGNGFSLFCPRCAWTYTHPFVSAGVRELRLISEAHDQEAHSS